MSLNDPHQGYPLGSVPTQQDQQYIHGPPAPHNQQVPFNIKDVTLKQKDEYPTIYRGYRDFSKWMSTDQDFYVLRQFSESSVRVALFLQHEIASLEEQLQEADARCMEKGEYSSSLQYDPSSKRRWEILPRLANCIRDYHQFIINQRLLQQSGSAAEFQIKNVKKWLHGANNPIRKEELEFLDKTGDLIPILAPDKSLFRRFLERFRFVTRFLPKQNKRLRETFAAGDFEQQTTQLVDASHLDRCIFYIIIVSGIGMLIGPLWWLNKLAYHGSNLTPRLGVITGFLVLFILLICFTTNARPFEVLAATAAYGAVLMVFIQLQQPPLASSP